MFAQTQSNQLAAAELASQHLKCWEQTLALRITLQKSVDLGNQLPSESISELVGGKDDNEVVQSTHALSKGLQSVLSELVEATNAQAENIDSSSTFTSTIGNKRQRTEEISWEQVIAPQEHMNQYWETVVNKWHARLNFGSEQAKSKLKVFNQSIWDQIEETLTNETRVIEKSRVPLSESTRMKLEPTSSKDNIKKGSISSKPHSSLTTANTDTEAASDAGSDDDEDGDDDEDDEADKVRENGLHNGYDRKENKQYDLEVYDDRSFYSMLLKTFITSASSGGAASHSMRADDLEALRKYKRKKNNVERKASKGRKIRYTVHQKLQNFMFPVPLISTIQIDAERLHASLFQ